MLCAVGASAGASTGVAVAVALVAVELLFAACAAPSASLSPAPSATTPSRTRHLGLPPVDWPKILQAVEVKHVTSIVERVTLYRSQLSHQGPHYTGLVSAQLIKTTP